MKCISPFRYPGGKSKLLPQIMSELKDLENISENFKDVFVGGGSVSLEVAETFPDTRIQMNDKDPRIAAFWKVTCSDGVDELIEKIDVDPTWNLFTDTQSMKCTTDLDLAFQGIFLNRTAYNGILSAGPIGGWDQSGKYKIDSHYKIKKLKKKILYCNRLLADRTIVTCEDFRTVLSTSGEKTAIYLDPPYIVKGNGWYGFDMSVEDHHALANMLKYRDNWLLSYDDCFLSRRLYSLEEISAIPVRYCIRNKWREKTELLIRKKSRKRDSNKLRVGSVGNARMDIWLN